MPRIKKCTLPKEIEDKLRYKYSSIIFEGSRLGFSIGDRVVNASHYELQGRIGNVVAFDSDQVIAYFPGSNFYGARGKDLCTMDRYSFRKV